MITSTGTVSLMTSTIESLDHLEGKTVAILADGVVLGQKTVADGAVSLDDPCAVAQVGLPYTADLETLNIEVPLADGTLQGRKVKVSQIALRMLNSRGGSIGPDSNTLHPIAYNSRLTKGDPIRLISGEVKENLGGGYADGGRIFVRQPDPLPLTISAFVPSITVGGVTGE